jgi:hypothetical protein
MAKSKAHLLCQSLQLTHPTSLGVLQMRCSPCCVALSKGGQGKQANRLVLFWTVLQGSFVKQITSVNATYTS